jgi:hypothetical protein
MKKKAEKHFLMSLDDLEKDAIRPGGQRGGFGGW